MTKPAAVMGQLVDARNVATHKCLRLIVDVSAEQAEQVIKTLGWPTQVDPIPVAVARLNPISQPIAETPPAGTKSWRDLGPAQQAGILCNDARFLQFLIEREKGAIVTAPQFVREFCGVKSRAEFASDHRARVLWHQLVEEYRLWCDHPELAST